MTHPVDPVTSPVTEVVPIPVRTPFAGSALLQFYAARAITGVEYVSRDSYARTLHLPHGPGWVVLTFPNSALQATSPGHVIPRESTRYATSPGMHAEPVAPATITVTAQITAHLADIPHAIAYCRDLLDADCEPHRVAVALAADPHLAPHIAAAPGLRLPGSVDMTEILVRALVGQQISVAAARTKLSRLAATIGEPVVTSLPELTHLFPTAAAMGGLTAAEIAGPRRRAAAIIAAGADIASGELLMTPDMAVDELSDILVARAGIGPWAAGYVAMRALRAADVLLTGDMALRHGARALGIPASPRELADHGTRWAPFRSYAGLYLWRAAPPPQRRRAEDLAVPTPQ